MQLDLGLVPRGDLVVRDRVAELLLVFEPAPDRLAKLDVEHLDAVPTAFLGPVLRGVRVGEESFGVVGRVEVRRDADARGDVEPPARDLEGCGEAIRDPICDRDRFRAVVEPVEQHRELVATQAGEHVGAAHQRLHAVGDLDEQLVAGAVPERVVHDLEVIDVEVQDADHASVPTRGGDGSLELVAEGGPVREAGQLVAQRLLREARVGLAQAGVGLVVPLT